MTASKIVNPEPLVKLQKYQIRQIEKAIAELGDDGTVYLIVKKGTLRFIELVRRVELGSGGA